MVASGPSVAIFLTEAFAPAPAWLLEALDRIEVTRTDSAPYGFQLTFIAERASVTADDYPIMQSGLLQVSTRIVIAVTVFGTTTIIADGFITGQQLVPGTSAEAARLILTAEDVSVQMALYEYSLEYPFASDFMIAALVLQKWMLLGILPEVVPTPTALVSFTNVPQQAGNDRDYLVQLAAQHGFVFFTKPTSELGVNTAYWGPPPRFDPVQPAFTIDAGSGSTVEDIRFGYDALAPQLVYGLVEDPYVDATLPVVTLASTRTPPLASSPALPMNFPFLRTTLFDHQGLGVVQAYAAAQAITDSSTDRVVTAQGSLDVLRYGSVLDAPGVVAVRGAGATYDGLYYVQEATHQISRGGYRQSFKLLREGVGSTIGTVAG